MASTSTINQWIDQLAVSLVSTESPNQQPRRRRVEAFRKRLRHHPYGRTNQFDVKDRLDGLEEKFQIRNRDDLSDALHERRMELRDHELHWLPDALDLLLRLSNDPISKTALTALYDIESQLATPSSLKLTDIDIQDEFDQHDPIWKNPVWSDASSEDDELDVSTVRSLPHSVRRHNLEESCSANTLSLYEDIDLQDHGPPVNLIPERATHESDMPIYIEEIQLIREVLLMIQGYPTVVFIRTGKQRLHLDARLLLTGVSPSVPEKLLQRTYTIRSQVDRIRKWLKMDAMSGYIQVIQQEVDGVLHEFLDSVNSFIQRLVKHDTERVVSLLGTVDFLDESAAALRMVALYVQSVRRDDAPSSLGRLYEVLSELFYCCDDYGISILMPIFIKALRFYMEPIITWLRHGDIDTSKRSFFIHTKSYNTDRSTIWHSGHEYKLDGPDRPPDFLKPFAKDIFICGKTSEFLRLLLSKIEPEANKLPELDGFFTNLQDIAQDSVLPFPAAFNSLLGTTITETLKKRTSVLKQALDNTCGLTRCLDAFDHIYLRKNGMIIDSLEGKIYKRMDRCQDNWNDRFLVADILEDTCAHVTCINIESIAVRSIHTSSRSVESRRRSVKIMSALVIEYALPWPVANIIPKTSMNAYYRISLHLAQIRRAKYVLERIAYAAVNTNSISDEQRDQKLAQAFTFILITFINTLYDHFTSGVIEPLTKNMRVDLLSAPTVDEMISVHRSYIHRLQDACLITKNYKVLRETLIGLLDMCIRFADLVSLNPSTNEMTRERKTSDDFETSSFMSAQSQSWRRRRRRRQAKRQRQGARHDDDVLPSSSSEEEDSDDLEDDDDELVSSGEGEGYSSFIVLDDNTTVAMEIKRLQVQFKRQLDFFVAGLKGVSNVSSSNNTNNAGENAIVGGLDILAERLTWKKPRNTMGIRK